MDIMSFNPDLNKQAQEVIFSKKMTKLFTHISVSTMHISTGIYLNWKLNFFYHI